MGRNVGILIRDSMLKLRQMFSWLAKNTGSFKLLNATGHLVKTFSLYGNEQLKDFRNRSYDELNQSFQLIYRQLSSIVLFSFFLSLQTPAFLGNQLLTQLLNIIVVPYSCLNYPSIVLCNSQLVLLFILEDAEDFWNGAIEVY